MVARALQSPHSCGLLDALVLLGDAMTTPDLSRVAIERLRCKLIFPSTRTVDETCAEARAVLLALRDALDAAERERDELQERVNEAESPPWPEWAERMLKQVRAESGYYGYDDEDGVDLPAELGDLIAEFRSQAKKAESALAQAEKERDEARFNLENSFKVRDDYDKALAAEREKAEAIRQANVDCKIHWDVLKADYDASRAESARLMKIIKGAGIALSARATLTPKEPSDD